VSTPPRRTRREPGRRVHASITITLDRYGHLMPGNENEAAGLLDALLARSEATAERPS
jgi:hypothetical protein